MQYIMFIHEPTSGKKPPTPEELGRIMEAVGVWHDDLVKSGHSKGGPKLERPNTAKWLRKEDGQVVVTDGPFAESKEVLGGFVTLECKDVDEAVAIASRFPAITSGLKVEVRQVMSVCEG